jgi:hypothetical protein
LRTAPLTTTSAWHAAFIAARSSPEFFALSSAFATRVFALSEAEVTFVRALANRVFVFSIRSSLKLSFLCDALKAADCDPHDSAPQAEQEVTSARAHNRESTLNPSLILKLLILARVGCLNY